MIEELNKSLKHSIESEVFNQTREFRTSAFQDQEDKSPAVSKAAIGRMVEKSEFLEQLDKKASKIDYQNCMEFINILHGQVKQVIG